MPELPDGTFEIFVIDAVTDTDQPSSAELELAIVTGEHKGAIIRLKMKTGGRDPIGMLGLPGTLTVSDGNPSLRIES
ncbi:MAG: hypothetical protein ACR2H3_14190 [Acidimicrobiales bacterium]